MGSHRAGQEGTVTKSELTYTHFFTSSRVTLLVQVNELTMQNEYQLRLKDLAMNEKVKELTEKFTAELDVDKTKFDSLLQEKNEQELEFEEKGKQVEEKHQVHFTSCSCHSTQEISGCKCGWRIS